MAKDGETIPLRDLIASLAMESIRIRKMLFNKLGQQSVLTGLESLLSSLQKLEGDADLEAWFTSQHTPEGLKFYEVKALIEKSELKNDVIRCFWNGDEETRPQKGKPFLVMKCHHSEMAENIYSRYVAAHGGRLPNKRQIPMSFAMQLYAEFVLHKKVNYKSTRPRYTANNWKISGVSQEFGHSLEHGILDCRDAAKQLSNSERIVTSSQSVLQESTTSIHTPCISQKATFEAKSSLEKHSTSSVSSTSTIVPCVEASSGLIRTSACLSNSAKSGLKTGATSPLCFDLVKASLSSPVPAAHFEKLEEIHRSSTLPDSTCEVKLPSVIDSTSSLSSAAPVAQSALIQDSKTRVAKSWKHLEGAIRQGLRDCNQQFEEVQRKLDERESQLHEAKQQIKELAMQLKEVKQQLEGTRETQIKLEETEQQLKETQQQLEEQNTLIKDLRWQLEARDEELKEANCRHQLQEQKLLEQIICSRIALHNAKHVLAYLSPHVFEQSAAQSIALRIVDPLDVPGCVPMLESVLEQKQKYTCGICDAAFNCLGWFTVGCGHSFHLHCLIWNLARIAACGICKVAVPKALYKSLGMDDLYPEASM